MSVFEKFSQPEKVGGQEAETPAVEVKKPLLKEILASKENSALFGDYLKEQMEEELGGKIASGELSEDDLDALSYHKEKFLEILDDAKEVADKLTPKTMQELIANSPDLKKIAELIGIEGVLGAFKKNLPSLAIKDRDHFESISGLIERSNEIEKDMKEHEERMQERLKNLNISEDKYVEFMKGGSPNDLVRDVRRCMGFFERITTKTKEVEEQLRGMGRLDSQKIGFLLEDQKGNKEDLGNALRALFMENEFMKQAVVNELRGESSSKESDASFREAKGEAEKMELKEEVLKKEWEAYETAHPGIDRDKNLDDFSSQYAEKISRKRKGFWASIFACFTATKVKEKLI